MKESTGLLLRELLAGQQQILARLASIEALVRRESARGPRDDADRRVLRAITDAAAGRPFKACDVMVRGEQVPELGAAPLAADITSAKQLGNVLVILRFLGGNLMAEGPLTGKGRQRAATTAYLQTLDRFMRLTQALGLERTAKQVPSPADWLEGKA